MHRHPENKQTIEEIFKITSNEMKTKTESDLSANFIAILLKIHQRNQIISRIEDITVQKKNEKNLR